MAGIYIHIPFCRQACHYCNFHFSTSLKQKDKLLEAICIEINERKAYLESDQIASVYFGGGTPSLLNGKDLESIFNCIYKHYKLEDNCEITLEVNPDDVSKSQVQQWQSCGINRISLGIQSFYEEDLQFMNRAHNSKQAIDSLNIISSTFDSVSADLIFGFQGLSQQKLSSNLNQIVEANIDHISCYSLTIEPRTPFAHFVKEGRIINQPDHVVADQFKLIQSVLTRSGYQQYEISNYAKEDNFAIHNSNYWKDQIYLGIGPSAHSYNKKSRRWNCANNMKYINAISKGENYYEMEELSPSQKYNEYIMTGLRTKWGVDRDIIINFGEDINDHFNKELLGLNNKLQLIESENKLSLTSEALLYADQIASDLFIVEK